MTTATPPQIDRGPGRNCPANDDGCRARRAFAIKEPRTTHGDLVTKDRRTSPRMIDAAVAGIVAFDRAAWHRAHRGRRTSERRAIVL